MVSGEQVTCSGDKSPGNSLSREQGLVCALVSVEADLSQFRNKNIKRV